MTESRSYQPLLSALVIGVAIVIAAALGARALERVKASQQTITATGSARQQITSDLIIWRGYVAYQANDLQQAYADLKGGWPSSRPI